MAAALFSLRQDPIRWGYNSSDNFSIKHLLNQNFGIYLSHTSSQTIIPAYFAVCVLAKMSLSLY